MKTFDTRLEAVEFLDELARFKLLVCINNFEYFQPGDIVIPGNWFSRPTYRAISSGPGSRIFAIFREIIRADGNGVIGNFVDITLNEPNAMFGDPSIEIEVIKNE